MAVKFSTQLMVCHQCRKFFTGDSIERQVLKTAWRPQHGVWVEAGTVSALRRYHPACVPIDTAHVKQLEV